jgi:hypothetical protein
MDMDTSLIMEALLLLLAENTTDTPVKKEVLGKLMHRIAQTYQHDKLWET